MHISTGSSTNPININNNNDNNTSNNNGTTTTTTPLPKKLKFLVKMIILK